MFYTLIYHGVAQDYCTGMISGKGWDEMYSIVLVVLFEPLSSCLQVVTSLMYPLCFENTNQKMKTNKIMNVPIKWIPFSMMKLIVHIVAGHCI